jgi:hypothetical protein
MSDSLFNRIWSLIKAFCVLALGATILLANYRENTMDSIQAYLAWIFCFGAICWMVAIMINAAMAKFAEFKRRNSNRRTR